MQNPRLGSGTWWRRGNTTRSTWRSGRRTGGYDRGLAEQREVEGVNHRVDAGGEFPELAHWQVGGRGHQDFLAGPVKRFN